MGDVIEIQDFCWWSESKKVLYLDGGQTNSMIYHQQGQFN